jgi:ABC-2 type transport system permease protein
MKTFTGTFRLVRLALRRDRIKLPAWILIVAAMLVSNIPAVMSFYGKTMESQVTYAATTAPSLVNRIFGGPINGPDIGEIILNETFLFTAVAIAFMSTLAVVRHTRQNEETGRAELIGSAVVGRHASLTAALIVAVGANIVLFLLLTGALVANNLPVSGSVGMAAALCSIGLVFAGVAAVTAQISDSARGANSLAAAAIGVAFLLRGVGDSIGHLTADKLGIISAWPSWLSPIGWGQQLHPFTEENWPIFGLLGTLFITGVGVAFYLNTQRDLGLGMISARKGPANAPRALLSPLGLARRLQRGVLIGWTTGILVMGLTTGLITKEFENIFASNPEALKALEQIGGGLGDFESIFFAAMFALVGIAIGGYAVQALQRMRAEESSGQLEPVLSTGVSRYSWMLSHVGYAVFGVIVLLLTMGVSSGITFVLVTDASWFKVLSLTGAAMAQLPAILALAGFAALSFALFPRAVIALSWSAFGACFLLAQFGEILKIPQAIMNISPFTHLPSVPATTSIEMAPLLMLLAVGLGLVTAGLVFFRRRDLTIG